MTDHTKALKRMDKIVANWYLDDFMMLGAWTLAEKIADPQQETMGIDTRSVPPVIRFNPNFVNALSDEVLEAIMASECFKILLKHPTSRLKNPREVSALSSTVTVDQLIMKNLVNTDGIKGVIPMPKDFGLPADSFYEEYFRLLMDKLEDTTSKMNKMFGPPGAPDDQGNSDGGDGDGDGDEGDGFKDFNDMKDALKKHMDPRGGNSKNWADNDVLDAEVQNFVDNYKGSSKMWGKFSGDAMGQVVAANTPKISWKEIVRRFNTSVQTSKQVGTRMKPNRRFDLDAPGRRRVYTTKILFAVDASGSMSDDDIAEGFAVINSTCRHAEIHYMLFDTQIKNIEKKMKRAKAAFKIAGRGGTDPDPVLKYVDEHKYDGLVVYSDMYFSANVPKPRKCKVLWLGTQKSSKAPVDWGYHANLNRFEGR